MFGISRQAYYQEIQRAKVRSEELSQVKSMVQGIRIQMPRLGTRKLYFLLKQDFENKGIKIGRDALFRYLKTEHMLIKPKKRYTKTTNSKHWLRKHPNLIKNMNIEKPNQVYVSDITYIKSKEKTHYLSLITDAYSKKIVGHHLSDNMNTENVAKALKMAVKGKQFNQSLIHHSDRGLQYCAEYYQEILLKHGIKTSMTDGYDCYQNAIAQRVNGILKDEFILFKPNTKMELKRIIDESIAMYNSKRPHLALNYKTPNFIHEKAAELIRPKA